MAIAPSNNLLSALSQLQSARPASAPKPAAPAGTTNANVAKLGAAPSSFAAQLAAPADAIRTAEQSLALLDQTFQTARRFNVGELDRMMSELQEVRRSLTDRVRACVERA